MLRDWTVDDFDYVLPPELIANAPVSPRDSARLLCWPQGNVRHVRDLPGLLRSGDVLVVNNTKVIPARLEATRSTGGSVEVLLHQLKPSDGGVLWSAFARPAKKLKPGDELSFGPVKAEVMGRKDEEVLLRFPMADEAFWAFLEQAGDMPLPPYIARPDGATDADKASYQTVYAQHAGSVAAPTAGLHFTPDLLKRLEEAGIRRAEVTLHVGAGTFQPVRVARVADHRMHKEWGQVSPGTAALIADTKKNGGRVIAVGTTSMRLLESAAKGGALHPYSTETDIFITPGFNFQVVDMLMTNFHLPKSTLLMLVAAFVGYDEMRRLYELAISEKMRFYSYGDSSLLTRKEPV